MFTEPGDVAVTWHASFIEFTRRSQAPAANRAVGVPLNPILAADVFAIITILSLIHTQSGTYKVQEIQSSQCFKEKNYQINTPFKRGP